MTDKESSQQGQAEKRFQKHLQQTVVSKIALVVALSVLGFLISQQGVDWIANISGGYKNLDVLEASLRDVEQTSRDFVEGETTREIVLEILESDSEIARERLENAHWKYVEACGISSEFLVTSASGEMVCTSISEYQLSSYALSYNNAICYNAKNAGGDRAYRAVHFDGDSYADVMYVQPMYELGELQGYLSVFLSGSSWNYYLSVNNNDGVITDLRGNAMYASKPGLLGSFNKYTGESSGVWMSEVGRYWVTSRYIPELSARVYSLIYYPYNDGIWAGMLILICMGLAWYKVAMSISKTMAEKNAASIEKLVEEVRAVHKQHDYRIQMNTGDEFEEIGYQINQMLEDIMRLNSRNAELSALNSRIEIRHLTAQINPHFLYNTLETIRNLVVFDAEKAEKLILELTDILRYSVDSSRSEVLLMEDMEYLSRYLDIQVCRFGERLQCQIDLAPECMNVMVPKLLIQPIVENSIKYGFRKKMELHIQVTGVVEDNILRICVSDDGMGMEETEAKILEQQLIAFDNQSTSIGLRNLSRRLYLRYGEKSGLRIHNRQGIGFDVYINVEQEEKPNVQGRHC